MPSRYSASLRNLRSLLLIRCVFIAAQVGLLWYIAAKGAEALVRQALTALLVALSLITFASFLRLRGPWPVTDVEYFVQLALDSLALTALLYFSGGGSNPFVTYYLLPVVISAALLPRQYTWTLAITSLMAYGALLFNHVPLPIFSAGDHAAMGHTAASAGGLNVHIIGMWLNFLVSVALITFFVAGMAAVLREQTARAAAGREDKLRNEQLLAAASLAAGTAHELGTPLATMAMLVEELEAATNNPAQREDLEQLSEQLARCRDILAKLSRRAQMTDLSQTYSIDATTYLQGVLEQWQVSRPDASARLTVTGAGTSPQLDVEPTLDQAIENLLNNGANACPRDIALTLHWSESWVELAIDDHGAGVPVELMGSLGQPIVRSSDTGLGLGLLISHATVDRYNGSIELSNRSEGGARALLRLPRRAI
ncbi:MAG: ATP-binding protein [Pseudomonadota bacterium]